MTGLTSDKGMGEEEVHTGNIKESELTVQKNLKTQTRQNKNKTEGSGRLFGFWLGWPSRVLLTETRAEEQMDAV